MPRLSIASLLLASNQIFTPFDRKEQWSTLSPDEDFTQLRTIIARTLRADAAAGCAAQAGAMQRSGACQSVDGKTIGIRPTTGQASLG
ncbi:MAG TPA: hypothetical protein VHY19_13655, partial [Steroidobacteraceae bacterium]|nr:hypothetical protein [Steroidobacteraceae bacterium]